MPNRVSGLFERYVIHDRGGATVEAVLWLPVFIAFFCLVSDVSLIFFS